MTAAAQSRGVSVVRGPWAIHHWARFLLDPVDALRRLYERHGQLVLIDDVVPFMKIDKPTYLAVGEPYNAEVLGNPSAWRTGRWSVHGPRESAQMRLGWGLTSVNGQYHAYYRRLL